MKIVTIVEPYFLPWLGYLFRLLVADEIVILDHVKYPRHIYCHRVQVNQRTGPTWISMSVAKTNELTTIAETQIANQDWVKKALNVITYNYCTCPYFQELYPDLKKVLRHPHRTVMEKDLETIQLLFEQIGFSFEEIRKKMVFSSEFGELGVKNEMNVNLVKRTGGDVYLSGLVAKDYNDEALFQSNNIFITYYKWKEPEYEHRWNVQVGGMSSIDALYHLGPAYLKAYLENAVEMEKRRIREEYHLPLAF